MFAVFKDKVCNCFIFNCIFTPVTDFLFSFHVYKDVKINYANEDAVSDVSE